MESMKKVTFETWRSSTGEREIHFFLKGTDVYVFGFHPKYVSATEVKKFLKKQGYEVKGLRTRTKA